MQIHLGWQPREAPSGQELGKNKQGVGRVFYKPPLFTPPAAELALLLPNCLWVLISGPVLCKTGVNNV